MTSQHEPAPSGAPNALITKKVICTISLVLLSLANNCSLRAAERKTPPPTKRLEFFKAGLESFAPPTVRLPDSHENLYKAASDRKLPNEQRRSKILELFARYFDDGVQVNEVSIEVLADWALADSVHAVYWIALIGVKEDGTLTNAAEDVMFALFANTNASIAVRSEAFGILSLMSLSDSSLIRVTVDVLQAESAPTSLLKNLAAVSLTLCTEGYGLCGDDVANAFLLGSAAVESDQERAACLKTIRRFCDDCETLTIKLERLTLKEVDRRISAVTASLRAK
jgi:hypothetical protein